MAGLWEMRAAPDWWTAREWGPLFYNGKKGTVFCQQTNELERGLWAPKRDAPWLMLWLQPVSPRRQDSSGFMNYNKHVIFKSVSFL